MTICVERASMPRKAFLDAAADSDAARRAKAWLIGADVSMQTGDLPAAASYVEQKFVHKIRLFAVASPNPHLMHSHLWQGIV